MARRRGGAHTPAERWASTEEGARVPGAARSHRGEPLSLRACRYNAVVLLNENQPVPSVSWEIFQRQREGSRSKDFAGPQPSRSVGWAHAVGDHLGQLALVERSTRTAAGPEASPAVGSVGFGSLRELAR